ncbi:MAG: O-antigen ligase family protein [Bacteroidetes bacterium]|nr:O-antigen ligase family protein [Bacteroidota bacterium]
MIRGMKNVYAAGFTIGLLLIVNVLRSGVLVDKSFLPRFFLLAVLLLMTWMIRVRKKNVVRLTFFEVAFILFYLWNLFSCLWAISVSEALMQSQLVFLSLALFLTITAFCQENAAFENIFIRTHLFALLFSFGLAFYKMSTLVFYDPYKIISIASNNNLYACFLIISLPIVFTGYSMNRGFWKYLTVGVAILAVFFIIIIQSRAAYLGLFFGMALSLILMILRYKRVFTKRNLLTGIVAAMLLFTGISVFYSSLDNVRKSYFSSKIPVWQYFKSYDNANVEDLLKKRSAGIATNTQMAEFDFAEAYYENANLRIIFWKKSFGLIRENPFFGVGAGNWRLNIPSVKEPANPEHTIKNYTYSQPHNEWISIITELGIVGFILAVFIFLVPVIMALRKIVAMQPVIHISAVFYSSFILGFYLFAVFDFPFRRIEHVVLLFSVMAFLLYRIPLKNLNFRPLSGFSKVFFSSLFVLLLLFTMIIAAARIKGEYFTVKMFRNEGKNADQVIHFCHKAENYFYRITPNTLPLAWFEGVAYFHKGNPDSASHCFQRALKSTPYEVRVLNDYAASLFSLKKSDEAKAVLMKTLEIDPFFDDARFNLGAIYYFNGQRDSALLCIRQCRASQKKDDFLNELEFVPGYPQ